MNTKHTPGHIHQAGFGELRSGEPECIDDVSLSGQGTSQHFCRVDDWKTEDGKRRMNLLAVAPEMLAALKEIEKEVMLNDTRALPWLDRVTELIAKAEGGN